MGNLALKNQKASLPPMLIEYLKYKKDYPDAVLFFQVGDFYEVFFEDAPLVARILNITLTSRDKNKENAVPMCGIPTSALDNYVNKLLDAGLSVAIVSQTESGKKGVARKLDKILTPAIRVLSDEGDHSLRVIASLVVSDFEVAIAYSQIETGCIKIVDNILLNEAVDKLLSLNLAELLIIKEKQDDKAFLNSSLKIFKSRNPTLAIREKNAVIADSLIFRESINNSRLFKFHSLAKKAIYALINYIDETTVDSYLQINSIEKEDKLQTLEIDAKTRINLDIFPDDLNNLTRDKTTLFYYLNQCRTTIGIRRLASWLITPLTDIPAINERLDAIEALTKKLDLLTSLRNCLEYIPDIERIAVRIELKAVLPYELSALARALQVINEINSIISSIELKNNFYLQPVDNLNDLFNLLNKAIKGDPPNTFKDGNFINDGYDEQLDYYRKLASTGSEWVKQLERIEREKTGIPSLKVKQNSVLGFFIEVTKTHSSKVPSYYIKRQTLTAVERFTTEELKKQEIEIVSARQKMLEREFLLFNQIREDIITYSKNLKDIATRLANLDVIHSLAFVASKESLVKPKIIKDNYLNICEGKHPVLSKNMGSAFVSNNILMNEATSSCAILTGPNMGGKSTFLRQIGAIVVMAQIGSFVPAKKAEIGVVDKLFARLGASDNILEGQSTFMVEMQETANILNNATSASLVLIDEIGRGTATYDGQAIAQAVLERLIEKIKCRTIFATHFHQLTKLEKKYNNVINLSVGTYDNGEKIIFTHKIEKKPANYSYGIEVAAMANLPKDVLLRANEILFRYKNGLDQERQPNLNMPLFVKLQQKIDPQAKTYNMLKKELKSIVIEHTTPLEALGILAKMKKIIDKESD